MYTTRMLFSKRIFSVLILIFISQGNSLHQKKRYALTRNEGYNPGTIYMYEDVPDEEQNILTRIRNIVSSVNSGDHDSERLLLLSQDATPNREKLNAGFELFGIPIGADNSYDERNRMNEIGSRPNDVVRPMQYIPLKTAINGDGIEAINYRQEVVRVPVKQLKQRVVSTSACAEHPASQTFPLEQAIYNPPPESRAGAVDVISEDPARRNERITAGLQLFGIPLGPQITYNREEDHKENGVTAEKDFNAMDTPMLAPVYSNLEQLGKKLITQLIFG